MPKLEDRVGSVQHKYCKKKTIHKYEYQTSTHANKDSDEDIKRPPNALGLSILGSKLWRISKKVTKEAVEDKKVELKQSGMKIPAKDVDVLCFIDTSDLYGLINDGINKYNEGDDLGWSVVVNGHYIQWQSASDITRKIAAADDNDDEPPNLISRMDNDDTSSEDDSDRSDGGTKRRERSASSKGAKEASKASNATSNVANATATATPASGTGTGKQKKGKKSKNQRKAEKAKAKKEEEKRKREIIEKLAIENKKKNYASTRIVGLFRRTVQQNKYKRMHRGFILIQALSRGNQSRRLNSSVTQHISEFVQFYHLWRDCIKLSKTVGKDQPDWASLREKQAYIRQQELLGDDEEMKETDEILTNSMMDAMKTMEGKAAKLEDDVEEVHLPVLRSIRSKSVAANGADSSVPLNFKRIHFSGEVVKWIRHGDSKYVGLFIRRMKQLSGGERSRILAKRLNGSTTSKVPIYETYLEQKSGYRILWTEKDDYLLVWYVTTHDRVSRLMRLIDDSKNRSQRQRISMDEMDEMKDASHMNGRNNIKDEDEIFLDPLGNVPMRVYDIGMNEIENIKKKDWTPALHLTDEERKVVETKGTVLLLGRSGTGKTICICNRMEYDRQMFKNEPRFSQLFVARSARLCTYVRNNIGESDGSEFITFEMLLEELENSLPKIDTVKDHFPETLFMRFSKFKQEVYNGDKGVDALIVWTNIRSFIKGSIEAMQNPYRHVSEEEYLSENNFGKKRCRLLTNHRKIVYDVFLKYKERMNELGAWDNCDRIIALVERLVAARTSHPEMFEGAKNWCRWSKLYVDEVQDYTQAEILLFFNLTSGGGNLFLAGDPAQNVTKGVEFRFDDIRSVGNFCAGGDRRLIPNKPQHVNVNFRSHAGILNAASSILSLMFKYFPNSATELGVDKGLFGGPRPGIYDRIKPDIMTTLVQKDMRGTVVLTHDENVDACMEKLGGYELVYGIRKAKGLEFKSVIIFDFFSSIPKELQLPWRELLLKRADPFEFHREYPQVEGQLKLLYTAVTRCIDRLYFAETSYSLAGAAFVKATTRGGQDAIATKNKIGDIVNMTLTQDEWLASGITNAEAAESEVSGDNTHAQSLMEKAIYCFKQASNDSFTKKSEIQLASFKLRLKIFNAGMSGASLDVESRSDMEKKAVELLVKLLKENLVLEAAGLGRDIESIVQKTYPSSPFLDKQILRYIRTRGGYNRGLAL